LDNLNPANLPDSSGRHSRCYRLAEMTDRVSAKLLENFSAIMTPDNSAF
jgi:hypothetical protein